MARELTQRLTALGRAHDLVRPLPDEEKKDALLGDLISVVLAPYDDMRAFSGRVRVSVPRMAVSEASATTLFLVIHELTTNSLKFGAPLQTLAPSTDLALPILRTWSLYGPKEGDHRLKHRPARAGLAAS